LKSGEPRVASLPPLGAGSVVWTFVLDVPNSWNGLLLLVLPEATAEGKAAGAGKPAAKALAGGTQSGTPKGVPPLAGGVAVQMDQMAGSAGGNISLLMDVPLKLTVELGRTTKMVKEILALAPGSVVELDKLAGEPVDILVNERLIAKGEVVVIDENFGVRITEIVNPEERLHGLKP
jgi:flagellar motor switch protein FliN